MYVSLLAIFWGVYGVCSAEPEPRAGYIEERLLEKMVEINFKLQQTLERLDRMEEDKENDSDLDSLVIYPRKALSVKQLETDDWKLVFRATSGNGYEVYNAWTQGRGTCEKKPVSMERSYSCHYRSRNLGNWSNLGVKYVKFALYNQDEEVAYVIFNGVGSDMMNWFSKDRIVSSSYSDLTSAYEYNYFSIAGHADGSRLKRRFFINRMYNNVCPADRGHVAVIDTEVSAPACSYDRQPSYPQFIYSRTNSVDIWERGTYGMADYLAVLLKLS